MIIKRLLAASALSICAITAFALPTVDAVQAEVQRGNFIQAEAMMKEVSSAKPGSARAHYVYAEILAHNKHFDEAASQLASARAIDPAIGFTEPAKFLALEQLLDREQRAAKSTLNLGQPEFAPVRAVPRAEPASGMPGWVWIGGLAAMAALAWNMFRRRPAPAASQFGAPATGTNPLATSVGNGAAPAYGPGYSPAPAQGRGLLGMGLAAAGGVAAGMLAEKLLTEHRQPNSGGSPSAASNAGYVPGLLDDPTGEGQAAQQLEERPVDFGTGDGWGGSGDAGSSDGGGWD